MMSIITNIGALPLPMFFFACWLVGVSLSTTKEKWLGIIAAIIMTAFRIEDESWLILLSFSITLLAYYRIYPEFISFIFKLVNTISYRVTQYPFDVLRRLPPFTSELLWLPLPNHDRILIAAFRQNPLEALPIFQSIQKQPLYGFQQTIKNALPQLVADQLTAIHTIPELITTATPNHAILPLLVPSLYQTELLDTKSLNVELLPTFQKYAQNIEAALQAGSIALRERGLERILDQLSTLNSQLSGLVKSKAIPRWQNVIKQWQTIIQQELEQLQRQSQGEILNPFQYGNPLTRDRAQLFKGRSAFADQIVRQILDRNRPTIILHGPRRCGKSSFLLNLPRLLTSDVLPVYIDLQSQSASQSEADFCFTIVRAIHRDARSQQVLLPAPPKREEFRLSPYTQLEDWLDTALTQLGDRRILLNIDEFEAIGIAMEQGRISNRLFDQLRSLIQHQSRLSFLFSGVQTLDELGTNWSSYFISAMPIEMTYLNPDEARELLLNPDPEFTLEYDTGIVDQILTLTRCHPYLLQLLGWVLVQLANTTHTQLVTPTLLQSAIPEAYINGIGYFTNVWEQFTGTNPTEITAGQQQLLALAQGQQPHPTNEAAQKSLQRMLRYHIIEKIDNQYKFEVPLIERWVREKSS
ncbi:AAA family ATPase [Pseudanabaena sp. BC1403]|uniref:AAA family ATPase n=1 Tax=Pseudanabaena sp. BC1403 TaxID=2043171 RepID=UPI001C66B6B6|nr:AAA family ATPase [Pseudanabaena sp. BC1403]